MGILSEFKEFAVKGNALELAVGLIIGTEFGKITSSMVNDILMPPIGWLIGDVNFKNWFFTLKPGSQLHPETLAEAQASGAITINFGLFVTHVITFSITAFAVFLIVKWMNRLRRHKT